nr:RNA-directed DNA polymerase, eukaryota, reverse transcriptase zinc-binding domain protein [Tanacetum cinerariifolium]
MTTFGGFSSKSFMVMMVVFAPRLTPLYLVEFGGDILKASANIEFIDPTYKNSFYIKVSNGSNMSFFDEVWMGNWNWRIRPHGRFLGDLESLISLLGNLSLSPDGVDIWHWNFESFRKFKTIELAITNLSPVDRRSTLSFVECLKWCSLNAGVSFHFDHRSVDGMPCSCPDEFPKLSGATTKT